MPDPAAPSTGCACPKTSDTPAGEPLLLRAVDVARLLSISKRTLFAMLSAGRMPRPDVQLTLGRRGRRWRRDRLLAWIASGCPNADAWRRYVEAGERR